MPSRGFLSGRVEVEICRSPCTQSMYALGCVIPCSTSSLFVFFFFVFLSNLRGSGKSLLLLLFVGYMFFFDLMKIIFLVHLDYTCKDTLTRWAVVVLSCSLRALITFCEKRPSRPYT